MIRFCFILLILNGSYAVEHIIPTQIMQALNVVYTAAEDTIQREQSDDWERGRFFEAWAHKAVESLQNCSAGMSRMDCLLRKLKKYTNYNDRCFVLSHIYLDKLLANNLDRIHFNREASCVLVFTSVIVAIKESKLLCIGSLPLSDAEYGRIIGLTGDEVHALRRLFLSLMGELHLKPSAFRKIRQSLLKTIF